VRGPAAAELGAEPDPRWLRDWNLDNIDSYWRRRAAYMRTPVPASVVAWRALGPGRLHHTIANGGIISKTAAVDYTAGRFPAHDTLLAHARAWRLGDDTVTFTAADGLAACDLVDAVAEDTARL
jgi:hypothetical protein